MTVRIGLQAPEEVDDFVVDLMHRSYTENI
jgi:hypothetical protein